MSSSHPEAITSSPSPADSHAPSATSTSHPPTAQFTLNTPHHLPPHLAHLHDDRHDHGPSFTPLTGSALRSQPSPGDGVPPQPTLDIEHSTVENDPRAWSDRKKMAVLVMVSCGSITPTLGAVSHALHPIGRSGPKQGRKEGRGEDELALFFRL